MIDPYCIEILEYGRSDGHIRGRVNGIALGGYAVGPRAANPAWIREMFLAEYNTLADGEGAYQQAVNLPEVGASPTSQLLP